jgi:hypothetical protein
VLPNVLTTVELGVPDSNYDFWGGMFMPAAIPRVIVDNLTLAPGHARPDDPEIVRAASPALPRSAMASRQFSLSH